MPPDYCVRQASVAVQTVYFIFRTKADLFKDVIAFASAGEDDAIPVMERAWVKEVEAAYKKLREAASDDAKCKAAKELEKAIQSLKPKKQ